jgi:hypothetical protein
VLGEALIEVEGDANVVAVVLALENVHDGENYNGFEVHIYQNG